MTELLERAAQAPSCVISVGEFYELAAGGQIIFT
jgi:hypothetical protein